MQDALDIANLPKIDGARIVILRSKWYDELVTSLTDKCLDVLGNTGADVEVHTLPGCLELPFAANDLIRGRGNIDAVICLGIVLKGDTRHFDMIVDECVRGLGDVSRETRVPIINEVIPVYEMEHAESRAGDDEFNKGIEAAAAAVEIIHWRRGQNLA